MGSVVNTEENQNLTSVFSSVDPKGPLKMMLNRFPLRSTSGSSQRASSVGPRPQGQGLAPPQDGRPRGRSLLGSDAGLSTRSGPTAGRRGVSSNSRPQAHVGRVINRVLHLRQNPRLFRPSPHHARFLPLDRLILTNLSVRMLTRVFGVDGILVLMQCNSPQGAPSGSKHMPNNLPLITEYL